MAGALTIIAVGGIAWAAMAPAPEDRKPTTLPAFELELLGQSGTLSSADLRGHPAVINFWASWCGPCNREAPALESTWRRYEDEGVLFLGIDVRDIESQAEAFLEKHDITYPSVRDPDQILVEAMKIGDPLPQTFFIDAAGKIQTGSGLGEISAKELETQIELLLDLAPAPAES
ncbi:MAG: cytochrome c biosis protein CcmG, thiol:disulfide interchange protein DsbE [Actinomycetota bacterium]|nr:cytochrome c biosis protein CcmG, thiol:disulfide interchange protein DsbE [Actinomycetota bacterium]